MGGGGRSSVLPCPGEEGGLKESSVYSELKSTARMPFYPDTGKPCTAMRGAYAVVAPVINNHKGAPFGYRYLHSSGNGVTF